MKAYLVHSSNLRASSFPPCLHNKSRSVCQSWRTSFRDNESIHLEKILVKNEAKLQPPPPPQCSTRLRRTTVFSSPAGRGDHIDLDVNTICVSPGMFTVGPTDLLRVVTLGVLCGEGGEHLCFE